jgi:transcriptional regulator with XRE-family HTH domain
MIDRHRLTAALKRALKSQGRTYRELAEALDLSEAAIKRAFAQENFSLERLDQIIEFLALDLEYILALAAEMAPKLTQLSEAQELFLVSDHRLLLVAICVQNGWTLDEICSYYDMDEPEGVRHLISLERQGLIRLLRDNRIRRLLSQDFRWLPDGPIQRFFQTFAEAEFLDGSFAGALETNSYVMGLLSPSSVERIYARLADLRREFEILQRQDLTLPAKARRHTGMLVALRSWELSVFAHFRRPRRDQDKIAS